MKNEIEIIVNNQKLYLDWDYYLREKEFMLLAERPLIPEFLWEVFGLGDNTLNNIRKQLKNNEAL